MRELSAKLQIIGVISSPYKTIEGIPIQPIHAKEGSQATLTIHPEYAAGLKDVEGFDRIWLITYLHKVKKHHLEVTPFLDTEVRGLFATRAPCRPNHFGLSCVKLEKIVGNVLHLAEVDLLDETPILDIKPYVADFDSYPNSKAGWYDQKKNQSQTRADERFK